MANILHVVNFFDPACDVLRCVRELNLYSKHKHKLFTRDQHPLQHIYQYEENQNTEGLVELLQWCDAIIYQFVGHEGGPDSPRKPAAFRNINIRWDAARDAFWCEAQYNARSLGRYKLFSSSHVGAKDFLPAERFRWLPDLIPLDGAYIPSTSAKSPSVSYIKHAAELSPEMFACPSVSHIGRPHPEIMRERRDTATIAIDNVCDGHFGLSGLETMALGLPTVVFNHPKTQAALKELSPGEYPPFLECAPHLCAAVRAVNDNLTNTTIGQSSRAWMEKWYHPSRIVTLYWDTFVDELLKEN